MPHFLKKASNLKTIKLVYITPKNIARLIINFTLQTIFIDLTINDVEFLQNCFFEGKCPRVIIDATL